MKIEDIDGLENRLRRLSYDKEMFDRRQDFQWERMNELERSMDRFAMLVSFLGAGVVVMFIRMIVVG